MHDETLERLDRTIDDLDKIIRRLQKDSELVGSGRPLSRTYQEIVTARNQIDLFVSKVIGSSWRR